MRRTPGGSNQVRARRVARELTQAQLAATVGVSRQTVNALEAGDYAPSVFLALRLAVALSATVEELFELDDGTTASASIGSATSSRTNDRQDQRPAGP